MENSGIILGYDLGDDFAQISFLGDGKEEAETLSIVPGEERFQIPVLLCKERRMNRWVYGLEAKKMATLGEGTLINSLLKKCRERESVVIEDETYEPIWLLSRYFQMTYQFVQQVLGRVQVRGIMFTVAVVDEDTAAIIKTAASKTGISKEQIFIQDYQESFYYYMVNGPKELWNHIAAVFTYDNDRISYHEMNTQAKGRLQYFSVTEPGSMQVQKKQELPEMLDAAYEQMVDKEFAAFVQKHFHKKIISSVFLIGDGFDEEWMDASLKVLCSGRRVFKGKNLYTKGACFGGHLKVFGREFTNHIYLGSNKLMADVAMNMRVKGEDKSCTFARVGENWFEANNSCEFILEEEKELIFHIHSYADNEKRTERLSLEGLPERPAGTMRLRLEILFLSEVCCKVIVKDVGFGEMYPPSDFQVQKQIQL